MQETKYWAFARFEKKPRITIVIIFSRCQINLFLTHRQKCPTKIP